MIANFKLPFGKKTLTSYELILTENCNFRCKYCFDDTYSDRTSCSYDYKMSLDKIDDIILFIEKTHKKDVIPNVIFFGGEPTMNWDFIVKFIEKCESKNYYWHWSMNTNVSNLTSERIDFLVSKNFNLVTSIDGIKEAHDLTRVFSNTEGTWNTIMSKLPNLISKFTNRNCTLSTMMVVDDKNFRYLEKNYKFLLSLGFDEVNILWNFESSYSDEDYNFIYDTLYKMFIIEDTPFYLDFKRRFLNKDFNNLDINSGYCQTPDNNVTINPAGKLFFCHRLTPKMSELITNNDFNEYFGDIYSGYTNTKYLKFIKRRVNILKYKNEKCINCEALHCCKGGCIGSIRNATGEYKLFDKQCKLVKLLYSIVIEAKKKNGLI